MAAALCLAGYVFIYATGRAPEPIRADGFSYYVYLPSWFLFGDPSLAATAVDCCGGEFPGYSAITRWPGTRRWVNPHPIGVAIMQAPLFLVAHLLTRWTNLSADGFTLYYQHAAGLSGLAWTIAGLAMLHALLRRYFSDGASAATLAAILLGTNLFHYATFDSSYSHAYSFVLCAAFLLLVDRWYQSRTRADSWLLGVVSGLVVLTRHTNILLLVCFPLYGVTSLTSFGERIALLRREWRKAAGITLVATAILVPQIAIYYQATGQVLPNPYGTLGFNFGSPRLAGVLFSVRKGVFFWAPVLLLACSGFVWLARARHAARVFVLPAAVFLLIDTYVIASWWDWQFGGSYGHRAFVDTLPVLAIGLAGFCTWADRTRRRRAIVAAVVTVLVGLSTFQTVQYWNGRVPYENTSWAQYKALFGPRR
jgi:hypothetical protein